jgi:hypothetical protein
MSLMEISMARQFGLKPVVKKTTSVSKRKTGAAVRGSAQTTSPLYSPASWRGNLGRRSISAR